MVNHVIGIVVQQRRSLRTDRRRSSFLLLFSTFRFCKLGPRRVTFLHGAHLAKSSDKLQLVHHHEEDAKAKDNAEDLHEADFFNGHLRQLLLVEGISL